jgi:hypothetical protein
MMRNVVALLVLMLAGCTNWGEQLYLAHDTKIGLDASINTATTSGSVVLGYDRRFITFVPRSVEIEEQETELVGSNGESGETDRNTEEIGGNAEDTRTKAREIMSVMACSNLSVSLFTIDYYDESLATGRAAVLFARALAQDRNGYPRIILSASITKTGNKKNSKIKQKGASPMEEMANDQQDATFACLAGGSPRGGLCGWPGLWRADLVRPGVGAGERRSVDAGLGQVGLRPLGRTGSAGDRRQGRR